MRIDWFDFWLVFSGILLLFLLIGIVSRFFQWMKFRQELAYIKQKKVKNIVKVSSEIDPKFDESFQKMSGFKEEIDNLKKDVYFDLYDKNPYGEKNISDDDLEISLEKLLDGKILDVIKEKDYLLQQKDSVIGSIEERNKKTLKEIINKVFFLIKEKDKSLKEKDILIANLKSKIQEVEILNLDQYISKTSQVEEKHDNKKIFYNSSDFIDVNSIGRK